MISFASKKKLIAKSFERPDNILVVSLLVIACIPSDAAALFSAKASLKKIGRKYNQEKIKASQKICKKNSPF
jgi:hypothetical protein